LASLHTKLHFFYCLPAGGRLRYYVVCRVMLTFKLVRENGTIKESKRTAKIAIQRCQRQICVNPT